jgi:exonuclease III
MGSENILCWNVRGLHAVAHRNAVRELVRAKNVSFICL